MRYDIVMLGLATLNIVLGVINLAVGGWAWVISFLSAAFIILLWFSTKSVTRY